MTWTWNDTWVLNLRTDTYVLRRPAGEARVFEDKAAEPERRWRGRIMYADGTHTWLPAKGDRRQVMLQAEALLVDRQPSEVSA
jgi:hypothetical protein